MRGCFYTMKYSISVFIFFFKIWKSSDLENRFHVGQKSILKDPKTHFNKQCNTPSNNPKEIMKQVNHISIKQEIFLKVVETVCKTIAQKQRALIFTTKDPPPVFPKTHLGTT